jgi:hypothetical protein
MIAIRFLTKTAGITIREHKRTKVLVGDNIFNSVWDRLVASMLSPSGDV